VHQLKINMIVLKLKIVYMGVSKNNGTPKSSILIGFSIFNHPFWGCFPIFWSSTQIITSGRLEILVKPEGAKTKEAAAAWPSANPGKKLTILEGTVVEISHDSQGLYRYIQTGGWGLGLGISEPSRLYHGEFF